MFCSHPQIVTQTSPLGNIHVPKFDLPVTVVTLYYRHEEVFVYVVYCESIKRDLKTKPMYECRCDERLKTRVEESTRLG